MSSEECTRCGEPVDEAVKALSADMHRVMTGHRPTRLVSAAGDVEDWLLDLALETVDAWFPDGPVDWEYAWDKLDQAEVPDSPWSVDLGDEYGSPAMNKMQRHVRAQRRLG